MRSPMSSKAISYLYVASTSYSGSTLLAFLLNAHSEMTSVSEVGGLIPSVDPESYRCSCGERFLDCTFYKELKRRIEAQGSTFDLTDWRTQFQLSEHRLLDIPLARPLRSTFLERIRDGVVPFVPGYKRTLREIATRNMHFARATLDITGKRVFVDAQKDPIRVKFLAGIDGVELRVIHLVRDVRAGAASYMKHSGKHDAERAARIWVTVHESAERMRRYLSNDRWLRIRYEDVCRDHQAAIDLISDFVGANRSEIPEGFFDLEHHIIGNKMRLKRIDKVRLDNSWKQRLSAKDLDVIARVGGRMNRYLGGDWP